MTTLTKRQFRLLLVAYCAVIVVSVFWAAHRSRPLMIGDAAEARRNFGMESLSIYHFAVFMLWLTGTILVAWLVGLVFTFLLWREGLYILLFAVCSRLVFCQLLEQHLSMGFFGWVTLLFEVCIITFGLFGPAKHLFRRQGEIRI